MYNETIRSNQIVLPPRRVLQPSRWVCSPYETNRIIVRNDEARHYQSIMCLGSIHQHQYHYAINVDKCRVTFKSFAQSFRHEGWVEAWIINAFCRKLFRDNHPEVSLKHFFFHTISYFMEKYTTEKKREGMKLQVMKALRGAGSAMTLHLSDMLYFPTLHMSHWFLFIVSMRDEKFIFLDSMFGSDSILHKEASRTLIMNFIQAWEDCGLINIPFTDFRILYPRVPKQANGHDCGIFVMKFLEQWDPRNQPSCSFSKDDIPSIRVKLCNQLFFCPGNIIEESKYLVQHFDPSLYTKSGH